MARLLVSLKLRLLTNALRASTVAKTSFIISCIIAALMAVGVFLLLAAFRGNSASVDVTAVVFTVLAFGWLLLPIFAFGLDGTLDPALLAPYPLRLRPLATGLLAASAAGAWPVANVIGLLGVTVGLARGPAGVIVAVIAVVLEVLFCLTLARLVTTGMAGLLRSRRGKDLAAFLVIPIFALYEFFAQVVPKLAANGHLSAGSFRGVDAWLRWLPPGLAAHAINDASDGHLGTALARLALLAAVIVVLATLWVRALSRALVTVDATTQSSRVRGKALPFGGSGLRGTVAARYWVYQRREPTSLVFWAMTAVIMGAISARSIIGSPAHPAFVLASAVVGAGFIGYFNCDTAGLTGPAFAFEVSALSGRRELRAYFAGHAIVLAAIAVPLMAATSFGLAEVAHAPGFGFLGTAVALASLGAALGVSSFFAVTNPYPMAKRAGNPMRQPAPGHSGQQFANLLANVGLTALLAAPVIAAAVATSGVTADVRFPVLIVAAAVYGLALAWGGIRIAAQAGAERLPELSQVAMASKM